jgi:hypothetical protein
VQTNQIKGLDLTSKQVAKFLPGSLGYLQGNGFLNNFLSQIKIENQVKFIYEIATVPATEENGMVKRRDRNTELLLEHFLAHEKTNAYTISNLKTSLTEEFNGGDTKHKKVTLSMFRAAEFPYYTKKGDFTKFNDLTSEILSGINSKSLEVFSVFNQAEFELFKQQISGNDKSKLAVLISGLKALNDPNATKVAEILERDNAVSRERSLIPQDAKAADTQQASSFAQNKLRQVNSNLNTLLQNKEALTAAVEKDFGAIKDFKGAIHPGLAALVISVIESRGGKMMGSNLEFNYNTVSPSTIVRNGVRVTVAEDMRAYGAWQIIPKYHFSLLKSVGIILDPKSEADRKRFLEDKDLQIKLHKLVVEDKIKQARQIRPNLNPIDIFGNIYFGGKGGVINPNRTDGAGAPGKRLTTGDYGKIFAEEYRRIATLMGVDTDKLKVAPEVIEIAENKIPKTVAELKQMSPEAQKNLWYTISEKDLNAMISRKFFINMDERLLANMNELVAYGLDYKIVSEQILNNPNTRGKIMIYLYENNPLLAEELFEYKDGLSLVGVAGPEVEKQIMEIKARNIEETSDVMSKFFSKDGIRVGVVNYDTFSALSQTQKDQILQRLTIDDILKLMDNENSYSATIGRKIGVWGADFLSKLTMDEVFKLNPDEIEKLTFDSTNKFIATLALDNKKTEEMIVGRIEASDTVVALLLTPNSSNNFSRFIYNYSRNGRYTFNKIYFDKIKSDLAKFLPKDTNERSSFFHSLYAQIFKNPNLYKELWSIMDIEDIASLNAEEIEKLTEAERKNLLLTFNSDGSKFDVENLKKIFPEKTDEGEYDERYLNAIRLYYLM